jgi:hypothetical protein
MKGITTRLLPIPVREGQALNTVKGHATSAPVLLADAQNNGAH